MEKSLKRPTRGYELSGGDLIGDAAFDENHPGRVLDRDIEMYSMCEHHVLALFDKVHSACIPGGRTVGLSKLPRVVEVFARQVEERLTEQIASGLRECSGRKGWRSRRRTRA